MKWWHDWLEWPQDMAVTIGSMVGVLVADMVLLISGRIPFWYLVLAVPWVLSIAVTIDIWRVRRRRISRNL